MESNPSEMIAEMYEREFPNAAGRKLAALTRKNEKLSRRVDELNEQIQAEPTGSPASKEMRKILREFVKLVKESVQTSEQISRKVNDMMARLASKN